jgi:hypothetical protein
MVAQGVDVRFAKRGLGYEPFAEGRKAGLHQTEQPNARIQRDRSIVSFDRKVKNWLPILNEQGWILKITRFH